MHLVTENGQPVRRERFVRLSDVERLSGLKKSTIYALMKQEPPAFPRCVQISPRCVAWAEGQVLQWVQEKLASAQGEKAGTA